MKTFFTLLLCLPVLSYAQVHVEVVSGENLVTPASEGDLATFRIISHEPVRIESCTLSFSHESFVQEIERLYLYVDDYAGSTLSFSGEALLNPLVHFPSSYVGILDDTLREFSYKVDIPGLYLGAVTTTISCRINFYMNPSQQDTLIGPLIFPQDVILSSITHGVDVVSRVTVSTLPGMLSLGLQELQGKGSARIYDAKGRFITETTKSRYITLGAGIYIVTYQECGQQYYIGTYIVP